MDNNDCKWPVAIGTTNFNILVAGAPKQGKSTAIGTIVDAIKNCPEVSGVKFLSIDTTKPHWDADDLSTRHPAQEVKALLPYFPTRLVFRVSDPKDSKVLLKSEAAFWELNAGGEMFFYDNGIICQCKPCRIIH